MTSAFRRGPAERLEHDLKLVPAPSKGAGWLANHAGMDWQAAALVVGLWGCCSGTALHLSHTRGSWCRSACACCSERQNSADMQLQ